MTVPAIDLDQLNPLIHAVLITEDITRGGPEDQFLARYRGKLRGDSAAAYDQLEEALNPHLLTPLFQEEDDLHVILLVKKRPALPPSDPKVNLLLFVLTLFSMVFAGTMQAYQGPVPHEFAAQMGVLLQNMSLGLPFGLSLMAILLAHEFGHYLAARYHKTDVTLPYFIPLPLPPLGTLGAFIQLKAAPKNKRVLHDIGVAGPLAGLAVTLPILLIGLSLSKIEPLPLVIPDGQGFSLEGNSILYLAAKYIVHGELLPAPANYGGTAPVIYWLKYMFTGLPTPLGGRDVFLHPMAMAGWAGLLVTALNLIPAGQLDGGHTIYVLFGKKVTRILPIIMGSLALLGFAWPGWWLWVFLIYMMGRRHAEPLDQITPLTPNRKLIAAFTLALFFFIFIPVPLRQVIGPYIGP